MGLPRRELRISEKYVAADALLHQGMIRQFWEAIAIDQSIELMKKQVKAKPNSKRQAIVTEAEGSLTAYLKSPPSDGKANEELIQLLAKSFGVAKSKIVIKSGLSSRIKLVEIDEG